MEQSSLGKMLVTTVVNCFRHPGLFAGPPQISVPKLEEQYIEMDVCDAIQRLLLNNLMAIKELFSPVTKDDTANLELNDDEIIAMDQEAEEEENDDHKNEDKTDSYES
ncbi:uncharacterized protein PHALS_07864 [Plasmopara halstedii]|uniref:Uncharacterized protein n=1 Tax=Plasmopara halstedii TaxID=4781 RepID=A0A0N7L8K6_PLAHL|nr:uncharacterized protein PHALS_07864 [Plasmopara halstedii]CEG50139.1 hypothetical protein PHALS_07864 [Plasmopara halstedii]|eukprot:XP_024586508.1 hypothetical protein PHALS_07864 [Plasmopara halstedii]